MCTPKVSFQLTDQFFRRTSSYMVFTSTKQFFLSSLKCETTNGIHYREPVEYSLIFVFITYILH